MLRGRARWACRAAAIVVALGGPAAVAGDGLPDDDRAVLA